MNWTATVSGLIDLRSFSSLWYWVLLALAWMGTGRSVVGARFDQVMRLPLAEGEAVALFETTIRRNATSLLQNARAGGAWRLGLAMFVLSMTFALGFAYGVELAQAVFLLMLPAALVHATDLSTAHRIEARAEGDDLRRIVLWHRIRVQVLSLVFIFLSVAWGMWRNITLSALGH